MKIRVLIAIFLLAISLLSVSGCIDSSNEPVKETKLDEVTNNQSSLYTDIVETADKKNFSERSNFYNDTVETVPIESSSEKSIILKFGKESSFSGYYSKENLQFEADVPAYSLPLKPSEIANYDDFIQKIPLTEKSRELLYKNGFVVLEKSTGPENLSLAGNMLVNLTYRNLKVADVPVFITTDSLLHLYHIQFDETLRRVEEGKFYDELWNLDKDLLEASIEDYDSASGQEKEAARRNVAYFAVALKLLEPKSDQIRQSRENLGEIILFDSQEAKQYSVDIPSFVKTDVETELRLIDAQKTYMIFFE